jgi:hypothetical protein
MLKYPNSKLARMYLHGHEGQNLFLDEDPEYFRIVLNFLRKEKVIHFEEENLFVGVCDLAKNLELAKLVEELEKKDIFSKVVLEIDDKTYQKEITIARKYLTRVPGSNLAKFFLGEQGSQNPLSGWISKKGLTRYSICRKVGLTEHLLKFMQLPANSEFHIYTVCLHDFMKELEIYGIQELAHYKKIPNIKCIITDIVWNENYNVN